MAGVRKSRLSKRRSSDFLPALMFTAPALLGLGIFVVYPGLRGVYLSFTEYNIFKEPEFIGLDNYQAALQDPFVWNTLWVTLQYVFINIGVQTVFALILAVLMHRFTKSIWVRGAMLLPFLISNVVVALVWLWLLDYNLGYINSFVELVGLDKTAYFGESTALPTIALINVWRHLGYTALLIFAGLLTIPRDVYEAAEVDGSGEWRTFFSVTLPLLRPVMVFVLILTITGSFQVFDTISVTTNGGPVNATRVFSILITQKAWNSNQFGYAAAISVILMIILIGIVLVQMRLLRGNESDLQR